MANMNLQTNQQAPSQIPRAQAMARYKALWHSELGGTLSAPTDNEILLEISRLYRAEFGWMSNTCPIPPEDSLVAYFISMINTKLQERDIENIRALANDPTWTIKETIMIPHQYKDYPVINMMIQLDVTENDILSFVYFNPIDYAQHNLSFAEEIKSNFNFDGEDSDTKSYGMLMCFREPPADMDNDAEREFVQKYIVMITLMIHSNGFGLIAENSAYSMTHQKLQLPVVDLQDVLR